MTGASIPLSWPEIAFTSRRKKSRALSALRKGVRRYARGDRTEAGRLWLARYLHAACEAIPPTAVLGRQAFAFTTDQNEAKRLGNILAAAREAGLDVPTDEEHARMRARRRRSDPFGGAGAARERRREKRGELHSLARRFGVDLDAPADQIKRRCRELAREHHPDHGGDHETMAAVNRLRELVDGQTSSPTVLGGVA